MPAGAWVVEDPGELTAFFANDRAAHIYSLIDLEEPYWSSSTWFRRGDAVAGVIATPTDGLITATGVSTRDPDGSLALLAEIVGDLPAGLMLTGPTGLGDAMRAVRPIEWDGAHVKLELRDRVAARMGASVAHRDVVELGPADAGRLSELYATEPGAAFFLPSMLHSESFVGVVGSDRRLIAAAGTHLLSDSQRLAALGSVYVHPDARGSGLGRVVTAAAIDRIGSRCDVIGLNVAVDNTAARAIYESLGFVLVLEYDEAILA